MKLEKARRRLENYLTLRRPEPLDNFNEAVKLGIEALKAWKERRETYPMLNTYLLPGETED